MYCSVTCYSFITFDKRIKQWRYFSAYFLSLTGDKADVIPTVNKTVDIHTGDNTDNKHIVDKTADIHS